MADTTAQAFKRDIFENDQGDLFVFQDGEFVPTTRQALETGALEAGLVGAGEVFTNIGRNVQRLVGQGSEEIDAAALEDAGLLDPLRAERPISTTVGAALPFVASAPLGGGSLPAVLGIEAGLGALATPTGGNVLANAAFGAGGGVAGFGAGRVAQRMLQARAARQAGAPGLDETVRELDQLSQAPGAPARSRTLTERQATAFDEPARLPEADIKAAGGSAGSAARSLHAARVDTADELGFTLTTGERMNSDTMRQIESGFRKSPAGPPAGREIVKANQENLNALWGDAMGVGKVNKITPDVMGQARRNAASEFTQAADAAGTVDTRGVKRIVAEARAERGTSLIQDEQVAEALAKLDAFESQPGGMAARDFMATRSELNTKMRQAANNSEGLLAQAYGDVLNAMDEAFEGSAGPQASALYKQAREHTRFIITLERGKGVNLDRGNVNPQTAGTSLRKTFKQEAGRGDPGDLSEAGVNAIEGTSVANYFSDIVGDSGTATRMFVNELIQNPVRMATLGTGQRLAGEAFDRVIAPTVERFGTRAAGSPAQGGAAGVFPLDIGGGRGPTGPLDL